jgi:hypothetical protein
MRRVSWEVYFTEPAEQWILGLSDPDYEAITAAVSYSKSTGRRSAGLRPIASRPRDITT